MLHPLFRLLCNHLLSEYENLCIDDIDGCRCISVAPTMTTAGTSVLLTHLSSHFAWRPPNLFVEVVPQATVDDGGAGAIFTGRLRSGNVETVPTACCR